jgi:hypothetical protein
MHTNRSCEAYDCMHIIDLAQAQLLCICICHTPSTRRLGAYGIQGYRYMYICTSCNCTGYRHRVPVFTCKCARYKYELTSTICMGKPGTGTGTSGAGTSTGVVNHVQRTLHVSWWQPNSKSCIWHATQQYYFDRCELIGRDSARATFLIYVGSVLPYKLTILINLYTDYLYMQCSSNVRE